MAFNAGSAIINIQARVGNFGKVNQQVQQSMRGIALAAAAAGAAVVATFASITTTSITFADSIDKVSKKLGITTDALQKLRFAAEQNGISVEKFDMSFQRFIRRLAEATQGTGEGLKAFQALGTNVDELARKIENNAVEALADFADEFNAGAKGVNRLSLAMKLFDSEGVAMVNLLEQGGDSIRNFGNQAKSMGLILDPSVIDKLAQANNKLNIFKQQMKVIKAEIAAELIPIFETLAKKVIDLVNWYKNLDDNTKDLIIRLSKFGSVLIVIGGIFSAVSISVWALFAALSGIATLTGIGAPLVIGAIAVASAVAGIGVAATLSTNKLKDLENQIKKPLKEDVDVEANMTDAEKAVKKMRKMFEDQDTERILKKIGIIEPESNLKAHRAAAPKFTKPTGPAPDMQDFVDPKSLKTSIKIDPGTVPKMKNDLTTSSIDRYIFPKKLSETNILLERILAATEASNAQSKKSGVFN